MNLNVAVAGDNDEKITFVDGRCKSVRMKWATNTMAMHCNVANACVDAQMSVCIVQITKNAMKQFVCIEA